MPGTVHLHLDGAVATLTLDNAAKRNSVDMPMAVALAGAARAIAGDERIGAVVLRGAGERAFCAGGDFDAMTEGGDIKSAFARIETAIEEAMAALDRVVPKAKVQEEALALAQRIATHPREAAKAYKAIIRGLARGRSTSELVEIQHRAHESPDLIARLAAIAAKRAKA